LNAIGEIPMCPPHLFGPAVVWNFDDELLAQDNSARWFHRLVMMEEDGVAIAFVVATVTSFFNYWHAYQVVLLMHGEPWIR
jgi:hypothetical protein